MSSRKPGGMVQRQALAGLLLAAATSTPVLAQPATVAITVDTSGPTTRLVLTHSEAVTRAMLTGRGRIEVLYAEPVLVHPSSMKLDDGILTGWKMSGKRRIVLDTGPGYWRYESFELSNPDRLILDLYGDRSRGRGAVRSRPRVEDRSVIVIDPGHGGLERGAVGPTGLTEKEITLDLARRLKRALEQNRSVAVVLTRDEDRLVGLDERTSMANHNKADLFLSIHVNAAPRKTAFGAETYFLSTEATDDEARTLAALENRSFAGDEPPATSDGERSNLDLILWDLAQNRYLEQSSTLAESVQGHLNRLTGTRDRGVRQAPFRVLTGATMPAILIEVGFISNPDEEARLRTLSYRNRVVDAIAQAVGEFMDGLEQLDARESAFGVGSGGR